MLSRPQMQVLSRGSRAVPANPPCSSSASDQPQPPCSQGMCPGTVELQGCCRSSSAPAGFRQAQEEHIRALKDHHNSSWPSPLPKGLPGSFRASLPLSPADPADGAALGKDTEEQPPELRLQPNKQTAGRPLVTKCGSCPGCPRQRLP